MKLALPVLLLTAALVPPAEDPFVLGGVKLSGPLGHVATTGDVDDFQLGPDGQWVAYLADQEAPGVRGLYSARRDGTGSVHRLDGPLVAGGAVQHFFFTPDGARVIYLADQDTDDVVELYSAPADGSAAAVKLSAPLTGSQDVHWLGVPFPMTSDGQTIVYTVANGTLQLRQLLAAPTDGSAAATTLYVAPAGREMVGVSGIAPDDATVVFSSDLLVDQQFELFKVPLDGSASPVRLNGNVTAGTDVGGFRIAPDASRVVYTADHSPNGLRELFSVPLDLSSGEVKLNGILQAQGDVFTFEITGDSQRVVYQADQDTDQVRELYSVPIDASAAEVKLNHAFTGTVTFRLSPDGSRLVYRNGIGSQTFLYTVPTDGSASPVLLNPPGFSFPESWAITPDSSAVVVVQDDLWSVPIDGLGTPVVLAAPPLNNHEVFDFTLAADSEHAVYTTGPQASYRSELYSVRLDGTTPAQHLNPSVPWTRIEGAYAVDAASNSAVFRGDGALTGVVEVFAAPLDASAAPQVLNDPLPTQVVSGEVTSFSLSPDGRWAVYADAQGFHSARVGQPDTSVLLSPPGLASGNGSFVGFRPEVAFTPDSQQVFFCISAEPETYLYRAPVDGSAPATLFDRAGFGASGLDGFGGFRFIDGGATIVYSLFIWNYFGPPNSQILRAAPVDGSAPPTRLGSGGSFPALVLSGDESSAVFATSDPFGNGLFSVPLDGSTGATYLPPNFLAYLGGLDLAADGLTVVFQVWDPNTGGSQGLHASPADASSAPTLVVSGSTGIVKTNPVTMDVAYLLAGAPRGLYHGPIDASQPATLLAPLPATANVQALLFTPDGSRIVYRADADVDEQYELYSVPVDGSQPAVKISGTMVSGGDVTAPGFGGSPRFALTSDAATVVFHADARVDNVFEMWSAPVTGGPVVILNNPLSGALDTEGDFALLSNPRRVLFRGNPAPGQLPVWEARVGQTGPFRLRSGPFSHDTVVEEGFQVTSDEAFVVYRADQGTQGVTELFSYPLRPHPRNRSFIGGPPVPQTP